MSEQYTSIRAREVIDMLLSCGNTAAAGIASRIESAHKIQIDFSNISNSDIKRCEPIFMHRAKGGIFCFPFKQTFFQFLNIHEKHSDASVWMLSDEHEPGKFISVSSVMDGSGPSHIGMMCDYRLDEKGANGVKYEFLSSLNFRQMEKCEQLDDARKDLLAKFNATAWISATLMTLPGVTLSETGPSSQLLKSRTKSGKLPLYRFHTLKIDHDRVRFPRIPKGGTHASPAKHDRRAHIRRLADGREVQIPECVVVGRGEVTKDYFLT